MVDVVVSHQALELKCDLVLRLLYALVSPRAEHYRPLLRRLAGLVGQIQRLIRNKFVILLFEIIIINFYFFQKFTSFQLVMLAVAPQLQA